MPKMIVGRQVVYTEVFEIDTDKLTSIRDDLDLCERILWSTDPVLIQRRRSFTKDGKSAIKFLSRTMDHISKNPIYPVEDYPKGIDEACILEEQKMRIEEKTQVRHYHGSNTEPWVVLTFCGGYVQPDGTIGKPHMYNTKTKAIAAEVLFHKLEE